jgi:hypothetical protein
MDPILLTLGALPGHSPRGAELITQLWVAGCTHRDAAEVAARLGLANRYALARLLHNEGLPSYRRIAGWIRVLALVMAWEESHRSLSRSALDRADDPAAYSRTVRRITGLTWTEVRNRGSAWVIATFLEECRPPERTGDSEQSVAL